MRLKHLALVLVGLLVLGVAGGALWVRLGIYNIGASTQHWQPVFWVFQQGKIWSIRQRAEGIAAPDLSSPAMADRGMRLYQSHCVQCHGAPGVARDELGRGMTPVPTNLVEAARKSSVEEIFWVVKHGIKMTGMPGWDYRMPDEEIWNIVAFVERLPEIPPAVYRKRLADFEGTERPEASGEAPEDLEIGDLQGSVDRGKIAIRQYACIACHTVPGIVGPNARVGPPLRGMASRKYIAGVLPNTTANMVRWLRDPVEVDPLTGMPDMDVSPQHARDMAAYLATLR